MAKELIKGALLEDRLITGYCRVLSHPNFYKLKKYFLCTKKSIKIVIFISTFILILLALYFIPVFHCLGGGSAKIYISKVDNMYVARHDISVCHKPILRKEYNIYNININGESKNVSKKRFDSFINEYNSSCSGCLIIKEEEYE